LTARIAIEARRVFGPEVLAFPALARYSQLAIRHLPAAARRRASSSQAVRMLAPMKPGR
jgi:hypothetical protein